MFDTAEFARADAAGKTAMLDTLIGQNNPPADEAKGAEKIELANTTLAQPEVASAPGAGDKITILRHPTNLLAKTWQANGNIKAYD